MLHKTVSKILQRKKHGKTTVQKDNIPTQKDNKHTQERGKDTPKNSKLTPKKYERARCETAEREWFRYFRKPCRKSLQARGRRTAQSHALQKEIL